MIWTEDEVEEEASRAGRSWPMEDANEEEQSALLALLNVLKVLHICPDLKDVLTHLNRRRGQPSEEKPPTCLPSFLFSKSRECPNYSDLMALASSLSQGSLSARFFPTHPPRKFLPCLSSWLQAWIRRGAIPVAAMNVRSETEELIPGSWHYSMIFGVGPSGVYGTNPIVCATEKFFIKYLSHPSEMAVSKAEVLEHWSNHCDLSSLRDTKDRPWADLNVLGQVIHTLREDFQKSHSAGGNSSKYIKIPCNHTCGILLFMKTDSEHVSELLSSPDFDESSSPIQIPSPSKLIQR
eukprot:TRINITY_DN2361_c0_g1_i3.p2 TRINITY_DN2361_c0_g1~~TRINITY_DN2361_c0_g1_i3.p2  ORF type:complete len:294 (+),score=79.28 TRINITY_DN2361_c0_g1_i3:554-1435(+)